MIDRLQAALRPADLQDRHQKPALAKAGGERVLRIEAVVHNTRELKCGRALDKVPEVVG
jgi:hypothetical protein